MHNYNNSLVKHRNLITCKALEFLLKIKKGWATVFVPAFALVKKTEGISSREKGRQSEIDQCSTCQFSFYCDCI